MISIYLEINEFTDFNDEIHSESVSYLYYFSLCPKGRTEEPSTFLLGNDMRLCLVYG